MKKMKLLIVWGDYRGQGDLYSVPWDWSTANSWEEVRSKVKEKTGYEIEERERLGYVIDEVNTYYDNCGNLLYDGFWVWVEPYPELKEIDIYEYIEEKFKGWA